MGEEKGTTVAVVHLFLWFSLLTACQKLFIKLEDKLNLTCNDHPAP
jgi:hypothetical protein